ncbi:MAG: UvrD-helicase domain-containing protein, partial [Alphaproteobacteria bacterium]
MSGADRTTPATRPDPNLAQRSAAAPDRSVWVTASAGSGKTKVLTDRVLRLLLEGTQPERIVCLTFTKAAAAEMDVRLRRRLGEWATAPDSALSADLAALLGRAPDDALAARARRLFAAVLDARGGPTIQTVHAFCQSLLRRFPLEARVAPHFDVSDDRTAAEELRAARDAVLRRASRDPASLDPAVGQPTTGESAGREPPELTDALRRVTSRVGEIDFDDLMRAMVGERGRLLRLADAVGGREGIAAAIRRRLGLPADATRAALLAEGCRDAAFDGDGLRRACTALAGGSGADAERAESLRAWLEAPDGRVAGFEVYRRAFFTAEGTIRQRLATKAAIAVCADAETILRSEAARLERLCGLCNAVDVTEATLALATLVLAQIDLYDERKRRRGMLDFDDLVLRCRALLESDAGWVQYKLDGGVDHVLIDEGQDTNPDQWAVVEALVGEFFAGAGAREGERTVFAVGDPKQSIFSFQRADPARFAAMQATFRDRSRSALKSWEDVGLEVSFRSVPAVLRAVDAVFARPEAAAGVVPPGAALRHHAHRDGQPGLVEVWP